MTVEEGEKADDEDKYGDAAGELIETACQRRRQGLDVADQVADLADFGLATSGDDHAVRLTIGHLGA